MTAKSVLMPPQGLRPWLHASTCPIATPLSIPLSSQTKRCKKLVITVFLLEVKHSKNSVEMNNNNMAQYR